MARNPVVFLDSSVVIAALLSERGGSFYILNTLHARCTLVINEYVLAEVTRVLHEKFQTNHELHARLFLLLGAASVRILPNPAKRSVTALHTLISKEDAPVLASALASCDYCVTLDHEFFQETIRAYAKRKETIIVDPKTMIDILEERVHQP